MTVSDEEIAFEILGYTKDKRHPTHPIAAMLAKDLPVFEKIVAALKAKEREVIDKCSSIVESEEELIGEMPEEIWEFVTSSRLNCANSHRMAVKKTKENIVTRMKESMK